MPRETVTYAEPWERQPRESAQAFQAFVLYRDMGVERGIRKVVAVLGKSRALLERWSSRWGWVERCRQWDSEIDRLSRIKKLKEIEKMRQTHITAAQAMMAKALVKLQSMQPGELSPHDVRKMLMDAAALERIARGEPGSIVEERKKVDAEYEPIVDEILSNPEFIAAIQQAAGTPTQTGDTGSPAGRLGESPDEGDSVA